MRMTPAQPSFLVAVCRGVIAAALLSFGLTSCAKSASNEDGLIVLEGEINDRMTHRLISQATPRTKLVRIRSGGGQMSAALDMAEFIHERKLAVEAFDVCMSACAAYVWMAGAERRLAPDTLLGFHGGQAAHLNLYTEYRSSDPRVRPPKSLIASAEREQTLYRRLNINPSMLFAASYLRGLRCVITVERNDDGFVSLLPAWSVTGTLPTASFLSSYNVSIAQGSLPETQAELDRIMAKMGNPELPRFVLTLPQDEALTPEQIKARLPVNSLQQCDQSDPEIRQALAQAAIS